MLKSKGKWMPGEAGENSPTLFSCGPCERSFTKLAYYEKHVSTELHFKRVSRQTYTNSNLDPDFFEQVRSKRSCRIANETKTNAHTPDKNRNASNNQSRNQPAERTTSETHVHCPTCFSNVEKHRMGQHLISHFHCQRTTSNDRSVNPERGLILDNIHEIVVQSPFQCAPCKYFFTQRSQLLTHFETVHLASSSNAKTKTKTVSKKTVVKGWSCSACREVLAENCKAMMEHLSSAGHLKMEATITKSIPIIIKEVFIRPCPLCERKFLLSRELLSHKIRKHPSLQSHPRMNNESQTQSAKPIQDEKQGKKPKRRSKSLAAKYLNFLFAADTAEATAELGTNGVETNANSSKKRKSHVDGPFRCQNCPKRFASENSLNRHCAHSHPNPDGFKCEFCEYTAKKNSHFVRHMAIHSKDREKSFICEECGAAFYNKYSLNYHQKLHTGKIVPCEFPGCSFLGRSQSEINTHCIKHSEEGDFACDKCTYVAKSKRHLKRHNFLRHEQSEQTQTFECKVCPFKTKLFSSLKRHELQHSGKKPFHCPHCSYATKNIENLRCHVLNRGFHPEKTVYNCRLCLTIGVSFEQMFRTNAFCHFQTHVSQTHLDNPSYQTRTGLSLIAGIKMPESDADNFANELPQLPQDLLRARFNAKLSCRKRKKVEEPPPPPAPQTIPEPNLESGMDVNHELVNENGFSDKDNSFMISALMSSEQFDDIFTANSEIGGKNSLLEFSTAQLQEIGIAVELMDTPFNNSEPQELLNL